MRAALILALAVLVTAACLLLALSRDAPQHASLEPPLPKIAPAPEFALTSQDGAPVTLADYRGKVVAVTFILTMCTTTCPILTPMMSFVQDQLGRDFGAKISFVSITIDPERDTADVLQQYAQSFGANFAGWSFLLALRRQSGMWRSGMASTRRRPRTATWSTRFSPQSSIRTASSACSTLECASTPKNFGAIS